MYAIRVFWRSELLILGTRPAGLQSPKSHGRAQARGLNLGLYPIDPELETVTRLSADPMFGSTYNRMVTVQRALSRARL